MTDVLCWKMKLITMIITAVSVLLCTLLSHAETEAKRAWIPPVSAVHESLTNNPALWPTSSTNAVLPSSITVTPRDGTVTMVSAEYLNKDITFDEVCDSVDIELKEFRSQRKNQRAAFWIVPAKSIIITVMEAKDRILLDIKANIVPDWMKPIEKKK